jgi:hypothetical protein
MKSIKILALGATLALAASPAYALFDINAFGGYATVGMGDINSRLDAIGSGANVTHVGPGFYVGADAAFTVMPMLKVGPRLEYVQAGQGKIASGPISATLDANLLMYELGVSTDIGLPLTGLSVQAGVWGGYSQAVVTLAGNAVAGDLGTGSAFVGEAEAELRYKLLLGLSLGVDLGYRMADVGSVKDSAGNGVISKPSSNDSVAFDFSGLNAGASLSYNF